MFQQLSLPLSLSGDPLTLRHSVTSRLVYRYNCPPVSRSSLGLDAYSKPSSLGSRLGSKCLVSSGICACGTVDMLNDPAPAPAPAPWLAPDRKPATLTGVFGAVLDLCIPTADSTGSFVCVWSGCSCGGGGWGTGGVDFARCISPCSVTGELAIELGDDEVMASPAGRVGWTAGEAGWEGVKPKGRLRLREERNEGRRLAFWPGIAVYVVSFSFSSVCGILLERDRDSRSPAAKLLRLMSPEIDEPPTAEP